MLVLLVFYYFTRLLPDWCYATVKDRSPFPIQSYTVAVGPLQVHDTTYKVCVRSYQEVDACANADIIICMVDTKYPTTGLQNMCQLHQQISQEPAQANTLLVLAAYRGSFHGHIPRRARIMASLTAHTLNTLLIDESCPESMLETMVSSFLCNEAHNELLFPQTCALSTYIPFYTEHENVWGVKTKEDPIEHELKTWGLVKED
ncbi:hypothetical protein B0H17DRAFT_1200820 [Mycena rosella]|uniref:Uncharacterized protein n=1 Tax=Mycena rosella TaxID=1033263 RepID=A0AAD7DJZ7_MYCRO|nr:hypothetical protein B0H17DRAFT_1200820 [Mycena rosella]